MTTDTMTGRERFLETMRYGNPDRAPYFEEGIRKEVIKAWRKQGLPADADLSVQFPSDHRERIDPDLEPRMKLIKWPTDMKDLDRFQRRLNPDHKWRLPGRWKKTGAGLEKPRLCIDASGSSWIFYHHGCPWLAAV